MDLDLDSEEFYRKLKKDNEKLNRIVSNSKLKYKKNFTFFYDNKIIEKYRKDFPDKVAEFEQIALSKEPWLKYQKKNLDQRVNKIILPSILEKKEGVSRKGVGAHLVHLSYSENHERKTCDYGDNNNSKDINYGFHFKLSDIVAERPLDMGHGNESIICDPSLIDNPHYEDCLDRLKNPDSEIITEEIYNMYKNGKSVEEIHEEIYGEVAGKNIDLLKIKKIIQQLEDYEIICMFFGLKNYIQKTQEDIARMLKITQPAVVKRINKIKIKLAKIYKDLNKEIENMEDIDNGPH